MSLLFLMLSDVWCHDYHLMFLPKCLTEHNSDMKVGWFLHTPFPSSEIHRTLPSRSNLLHAVLAADLVGFHTYDYARHFVSACTRILGLEDTPEGVENQGRSTRGARRFREIVHFSCSYLVIGFDSLNHFLYIDSDRFIRALEFPQVREHIRELKETFADRKVPYITTALMDAKLGTEGRKDLFDWLSRQLSGLKLRI
ncbi:Alpha,alpha-trehalose-phosphate synthase [UDP-forming] 1 [Camellia lanceoleosa]|uniref:Alpha,alpha-trehalose-phosphate synthase [UDP-forming] 1 n=1 Tax=Camellia lanceoleosa TaxID=1840588 RepID=A0ACC0HKH8_9ERIC|nr:Alpha,alpha-trehalose-phosphate synthase [UDP-forming] 1 [Camellia lanceoleosa]